MKLPPRRESKRKALKASRATSNDSGGHVKVIPANSKPRTGGNSDWEAPAGKNAEWRK